MNLLLAGNAALTRVAFLADPTDVGDEKDKAGPIAIAIVIILCVACFFLFRSMSKHLRRVRDDFPGSGDAATPPSSSATTTTPTTTTSGPAVLITDAKPPAGAAEPAADPPAGSGAATSERETPSDTRSG